MSICLTGIAELAQPALTEGSTREPLSIIRDAALWIDTGTVCAVGSRDEVERQIRARAATPERLDLGGRAVLPGFVDSHTHIVFAKDRVDEMARRARGETYEQIAAAGGGIVRSMAALRDAPLENLVSASRQRLDRVLRRGTTTCEIKSGYGLWPELEHKHLDAIEALAAGAEVSVLGTVLAHVVPPEARVDRAAFVARFADEVIEPAAARAGVRYLDVFVERGAYSADEARMFIARGRAAGLQPKLHVDQLHDGGGAHLAAEVGALSADHLEHTSPEGMAALARAGTVATILPGCALFLGQDPWPRGRALRDAGCEVAVATDFNPGSSHLGDLALCGALAATRCGLSLEEALWGITRGGAKALGLEDRGTLRQGERADFVVLGADDWRRVFYEPGAAPIDEVWVAGRCAATRSS